MVHRTLDVNLGRFNDLGVRPRLSVLGQHPEARRRSFCLLGQINERRGRSRARAHYPKFVDLWGDGDLARDWIGEAREKFRN